MLEEIIFQASFPLLHPWKLQLVFFLLILSFFLNYLLIQKLICLAVLKDARRYWLILPVVLYAILMLVILFFTSMIPILNFLLIALIFYSKDNIRIYFFALMIYAGLMPFTIYVQLSTGLVLWLSLAIIYVVLIWQAFFNPLIFGCKKLIFSGNHTLFYNSAEKLTRLYHDKVSNDTLLNG
jgi:hypothetical protein